MEGNRDEAEKCIQIAAQALRESKIEKAEKFLQKAEKLYPSQKAKGKVNYSLDIWALTLSHTHIQTRTLTRSLGQLAFHLYF